MSTQVQFRRGTTTQNNAFTGANGEISIDTDVKTIRLHDGVTGGGAAIMLNTTTAQTALNKTFSTGSVWTGNAVALAYGGTGSSLSAVSGAVAYSGASGLGLSAAGTSGQVLVSGGTGSPVWVNASSLTTGVATTAVSATNISGGSAGQLLIQSDTSLTTFINAGASGTFLQSAGAGYAPTWAAGQVTLGSTAVPLGGTITTFSGLTNLIMGNGSFGNGTIAGPGISGSGPWTVTVTGITSTTGLSAGQQIVAAAGTGSLYNSPTSVVIASVVSSTSITVTVTGGTTPTAGTITGITVLGYLQVPVGTTVQRSWAPAVGMIRYNSDQVSFEGYSSGAWSSLGGVSSVDKYTYIRAETSAGASNGELEFFAKNSAGTAAVKVAGMNYSRFLEATGTVLGTQTTQNLFNTVATTVNAFGAATAITLGNATSATLTLNPGTLVGSNTTQTVFDTTATTVNAFGAATTLTLGNATSATVTIRPGTVVGSNTTQNLYNTTATTLNIGGAATTLALGASTGTATIANPTVTLTNATALNLNGSSPALATTSTTASVFNSNVTTLNIGQAATTLYLGANSGTVTIGNPTVVGVGTTQNLWNTTATSVNAFGAATTLNIGANSGTLTLNNPTIVGTQTTQNLFNTVATTLNIGGAATTVSIGAGTGTTTVNNNLTITGNLTVNGTTTTVNNETIVNIITVSTFDDTVRTRKSFSGSTSGATPTAITTFDKTVYRSGVIEVQVVNGTAYRVLRLMFVHDGTNVTLSENYLAGVEVQTAATNTTFTASIAASTLTVYATCSSGTAAIKGESIAFKV